MKLYYAPPSPFARKVRVMVRERAIAKQVEEISVNPHQDDPRLLAVNPAGLVPVMVLDDALPLIDSRLICQHVELMTEGQVPDLQDTRHGALADAVLDFAVLAVAERRHPDAPSSQAFLERKLAKIERCVLAFPKGGEGAGRPLTLAEITIGCALAYLDFRFADFDWRALRPDLGPWLEGVQRRPSFKDTAPTDQPV